MPSALSVMQKMSMPCPESVFRQLKVRRSLGEDSKTGRRITGDEPYTHTSYTATSQGSPSTSFLPIYAYAHTYIHTRKVWNLSKWTSRR